MRVFRRLGLRCLFIVPPMGVPLLTACGGGLQGEATPDRRGSPDAADGSDDASGSGGGETSGGSDGGGADDGGGGDSDGGDGEDVVFGLSVGASCENPCTLAVEGADGVVEVHYEVDGWSVGSSDEPDSFGVSYTFGVLGERTFVALGLDALAAEVARDEALVEVTPSAACAAVEGSSTDSSPVQTTGAGTPSGAGALSWQVPTAYTYTAPFSGTPGEAASHEGLDYVHDDSSVSVVDVAAAADGVVAYVRLGCPQSSVFGSNASARECGAGWGNHVVVSHGGGLYTRSAHLDPDDVDVRVGDRVSAGDRLAGMGNSGRSDVRHLHFEVGVASAAPDPCGGSFSFEAVHDPADLGL